MTRPSAQSREWLAVVAVLLLGSLWLGAASKAVRAKLADDGDWHVSTTEPWTAEGGAPALDTDSNRPGWMRLAIPRTWTTGAPSRLTVHRSLAVIGGPYLLRFRARADAPRPLEYLISPPNHTIATPAYALGRIALTPDWQEISAAFDTSADEVITIAFSAGQSNVDLELDEVSASPAPNVGPGEWASWTLDLHQAEARAATARLRHTTEGELRHRVEPTADWVAGEPWSVQLLHRPVRVDRERAYTLRFDARADEPRPLDVLVEHGTAPFGGLGLYERVDVGPAWKTYVLSFVANDDDPEAIVAFNLGQARAAVELRHVAWSEPGAWSRWRVDGRTWRMGLLTLPPFGIAALLWLSRPRPVSLNPTKRAFLLRWPVVALSIVALAWHTQHMLRGVSWTAPDPVTYTLAVPADPGAGPQQLPLQLRRVIVDGHEIRPADLERRGAWTASEFALTHADDRSATVTVTARTLTVCVTPSGGAERMRIDSGGGRQAVVGSPVPHRFMRTACEAFAGGRRLDDTAIVDLTGLTAFVVVALAAWRYRPWRSSRALAGWVIAYVGALHLLVWLSHGVGFNADAIGYIGGITSLALGEPSYLPPGYPLFLAPWWLFGFSHPGFVTAGVQHLCLILTLVALRGLVAPLLGEDLSTLGVFIAGSLSPTLLLPQMLISEGAALFSMTGALWLASVSSARGRLRRDLLAGVLIGWAGLVRVVPVAAVLLPVFLLHRAHQDMRASLWRTCRAFAAAALVLVACASWNGLRTGSFAISTGAEAHLYNRVVVQQHAIDRTGPFTRALLAHLGDRPIADVPHWRINEVLDNQGLSNGDVRRLMGGAALEGIAKNPAAFFRYSLWQSLREYAAIPWFETWPILTPPVPELESPVPLGFRAASALWLNRFDDAFFATVWPRLMFVPAFSLLLLPFLRQRLVLLAIFAVPVGYLLATAQIEYYLERYIVAVLPFMFILIPTPLAALLLWLGIPLNAPGPSDGP